ncbi:hypothetical protein KPP03845_200302 (plasmid) [Streptomyces xanthophaeus]|uniref:hypothetical protein n=1 Tax=Streptomyces xanthophaeus TaxID=67385 RepID=UPI00233F03B3|nr:hypothetical protein [Streptomyces xanthophaeus]WCD91341.1 hypothetical protein KPP03845_200302 [Streptomyces xanthophaeus]
MPTSVLLTSTAQRQVSALRKSDRTSYDQFLAELKSQGCRALGYRLTGPIVEHLCVKHLRGALRVIVGFLSREEVVILLVGPHADDDRRIDVYTALYLLAGLENPPEDKRTKPSCCGDISGLPPMEDAIVDSLVQRSQELAKGSTRRRRRS